MGKVVVYRDAMCQVSPCACFSLPYPSPNHRFTASRSTHRTLIGATITWQSQAMKDLFLLNLKVDEWRQDPSETYYDTL